MSRKPSQKSQIEKFKILTAKNEQNPFKYPNTKFYTMPMGCGDYTIEYNDRPYYDKIIVERKGNVSEIYSATGSGRERWERELEKISKVDVKIVLCEFSFMDLVNHQPPGILPASAVYGSICKWNAVYDVPFIFCENRINAKNYMYKLFYEYTKHKILNF
jgi:hypothetical protein